MAEILTFSVKLKTTNSIDTARQLYGLRSVIAGMVNHYLPVNITGVGIVKVSGGDKQFELIPYTNQETIPDLYTERLKYYCDLNTLAGYQYITDMKEVEGLSSEYPELKIIEVDGNYLTKLFIPNVLDDDPTLIESLQLRLTQKKLKCTRQWPDKYYKELELMWPNYKQQDRAIEDIIEGHIPLIEIEYEGSLEDITNKYNTFIKKRKYPKSYNTLSLSDGVLSIRIASKDDWEKLSEEVEETEVKPLCRPFIAPLAEDAWTVSLSSGSTVWELFNIYRVKRDELTKLVNQLWRAGYWTTPWSRELWRQRAKLSFQLYTPDSDFRDSLERGDGLEYLKKIVV